MSRALLFVEDEEDIRELIVEKLRASGFLADIYEASDPVKALEHFHAHKDELRFVVCDYYLPIQNGNDLCQMIKDTSPDIKIICLTGDTTVKLEDHKTEIDIVLYKPEGVDELVKILLT